MIVSLSGIIIPLILFMILLYGMISKKEMYQPFLEGVQDGFKVVIGMPPTLIALFLAVQFFRDVPERWILLVSVLSPVRHFKDSQGRASGNLCKAVFIFGSYRIPFGYF